MYYRNNDWDSLIKYCLDDVKVTREVYEYGLAHGNIWYHNAGQKENIVARWGRNNGGTIEEKIKQALTNGDQVEIDYMDEKGQTTTRKIDIQRIQEGRVKSFGHLRNGLRIFEIAKIKKVQVVGKMDSWQNTLL